jgi:hypothetical protein
MTTIAFSALSFSTGALALLCVCILWMADGRALQLAPQPVQPSVVCWPEHLKLREYNLKPHEVKDWSDLMRQRGFELYTLIPPSDGYGLVRVMYRKVRSGRGPYNALGYTQVVMM